MKRTISIRGACALSVALLFGFAFAQEDAAAGEAADAGGEKPAEEKAAEAEDSPIPAAQAEAPRVFHALVRCKEVSGTVEVLKPRTEGWTAVEEGRYYPLGSAFRSVAVKGEEAAAVFEFGPESFVSISGPAEFATREAPTDAKDRVLELRAGRVTVKLPRTMTDGLFSVAAPHFTCRNLAGESVFDYDASGDGDKAVVRVVMGSLALDGRHYRIARMSSANQIGIRTSEDALATVLTGESGDYAVTLDQGVMRQRDFDTGENKEIVKTTSFQLSPQCVVKLFRSKSEVGGRMIVSVLTMNPSGEVKNRYTFAEGLYNVNTGEEIVVTAVKDIDKDVEKSGESKEDSAGEGEKAEGAEGGEAKEADQKQEGGAVETPAVETPDVSF